MPIRTRHVVVGVTPTQILFKGDTGWGFTVYVQTAVNKSCFVGGSDVTATSGILVPTSSTAGSIPAELKVGGSDLWGITSVGTTDLVVMYIEGPWDGPPF